MSTASVPKEFDETLYSLFDEYGAQNIPIAVDFRQLVSDVAFGARASHSASGRLEFFMYAQHGRELMK